VKATVRLAVVGAGLIGRQHVARIEAEPTTRLAAIVDPSPAAKQMALERGVPWAPDLAGIDLSAICDGAIVATPNQMHVLHAGYCVEQGLPVLIEKPIADHSGNVSELIETAERKGVRLLVGHHRRHSVTLQRAKAAIDAGDLGRIVTAHAVFWTFKPRDYFTEAWRTKSGGGPVLINAVHDVDCLRFLMGDVSSVHAFLSNAVRGHEVEDTATVLLRFASGALATISISDTAVSPWSWEMTSRENPAYPPVDEACYYLAGTRGALAVPNLWRWTQSEPSWLRPLERDRLDGFEPADPLVRQLQHFRDVILGDALPLVSGREGLETLRVIEGILESARTGMTVQL
jgi:predicted dehydrogenase